MKNDIGLNKLIIIIFLAAILVFSIAVYQNLISLNQSDSDIIKVIRFQKSEEINVTESFGRDFFVANFVWTPDNPSKNIILSARFSLEYRHDLPEDFVWSWGDVPSPGFITFNLMINNFSYNNGIYEVRKPVQLYQNEFNRWRQWQPVLFLACENSFNQDDSQWIVPNQKNYNLTLHTLSAGSLYLKPACIKNLSIILEVIDG